MKLWIITGSSTDDGAPIYLQANGNWSRTFANGFVVDTMDERDEMCTAARQQQRVVCDPYAIEVRRDAGGQPVPTSLKQKIRAEGPTVSLVEASPQWRRQFARSRVSA